MMVTCEKMNRTALLLEMRRKPIKLNNEVKMRQTWPFLLFTSIYFIITLISTNNTIAPVFFILKKS
jgi:hypothetical protein